MTITKTTTFQVLIVSLVLAAFVAAVAMGLTVHWARHLAIVELESLVAKVGQHTANNIGLPLYTLDDIGVNSMIEAALDHKDVISVQVTDRQTGLRWQRHKDSTGAVHGPHWKSFDIEHNKRVIGHLRLAYTFSYLDAETMATVMTEIVIVALALLVMVFGSVLVHKILFVRPLRRVIAAARDQGQALERPFYWNRDDEIGELVSAFDDVLDRTRLLLRENEEKTTALGALNRRYNLVIKIIGHDFRSRFNHIIGFAKLLLQENSSMTLAQRREYAGYILKAGQEIYTDVENLFALAWIGDERTSLAPVDLGHMVQAVMERYRPRAVEKGLTLAADCPPSRIRSNRAILYAVVDNLVRNAIGRTDSGGTVTVTVTPPPAGQRAGPPGGEEVAAPSEGTADREETEKELQISVKDTGSALDSDVLDNIRRLQLGLPQEKGDDLRRLGLSMHIVLEGLQKLEGRLKVVSEPETGSVFSLQLPLSSGHARLLSPPAVPSPATPSAKPISAGDA